MTCLLRVQGLTPQIRWKIVRQSSTANVTCVYMKRISIINFKDRRLLLNERNAFLFKCRHKSKFELSWMGATEAPSLDNCWGIVHPFGSSDTVTSWKKSRFIFSIFPPWMESGDVEKSSNKCVVSIEFLYILLHWIEGCPHGIIVEAMDCRIVVSEFVLQSRYYIHFRANTLGKGMNPLILSAMG